MLRKTWAACNFCSSVVIASMRPQRNAAENRPEFPKEFIVFPMLQ